MLALRRASLRVVMAPGPVFLLLFLFGFGVFVVLAVFFGKETAPGSLLVVVPLAVVVIAIVLRRSRGWRRSDESGTERSDQGSSQKKRGDVLMRFLEFVHANPPGA